MTRLLSDRRTTFMVVSTLEATPVREAEFFSAELHGAQAASRRRRPQQGAARVPARRRDRQAGPVDDGRAGELAEGLTDDPVVAARVLGEVAESFLNFGVVARREAEQQAELKGAPDVLVTVPFFDADIYDMGGTAQAGRAGLGLSGASGVRRSVRAGRCRQGAYHARPDA